MVNIKMNIHDGWFDGGLNYDVSFQASAKVNSKWTNDELLLAVQGNSD